MWILTAAYFAVFSALFWILFWFYAKALIYFGMHGKVIQIIGGLFTYLLFACLILSPLFVASKYFEGRGVDYSADKIYVAYFMICYFLSVVPGIIYFKKKRLSELKDLGYFKRR